MIKIQGMVDTVKERGRIYKSDDALDIVWRAQQCWMNLSRIREQRSRCYRYYYGNQWSDKIKVKIDGVDKIMTEAEYLRSIGQTPLQNNLIRRLVRTVLGVYRSQMKEPTCVARDRGEQQLGETMSVVLQYNQQRNRMKELNARTIEDFLVGGIIAHRKCYERRKGTCDNWTDYVNPDYFFFDQIMSDIRTWDVSLIGQIHDVSFRALTKRFAKTQADYEKLSNEYNIAKGTVYSEAKFDRFFSQGGVNDFLIPKDPSVCRVLEVWTLENKSRYHCHDWADGTCFKIDAEDYNEEIKKRNDNRKQMARAAGVSEDVIKMAEICCDYVSRYGVLDPDMQMPDECRLITAEPYIDDYWYYRFITTTGMVLEEGETPFKHGGHPFIFRLYPFLNGEVHSFVDDCIDLQRQINRTATQIDLISRATAKGVLLIPKSTIPVGSNSKIMGEQWSKPNGVIEYEDDHGRNPKPTQENASMNSGHLENMLGMQQKMLEDASGVHGAAQGKPGASQVSGVLYAQQAQNSTMTLLDILDTYAGFEEECAIMDVQNIQQYYDDTRVLSIAGSSAGTIVYDPRKIKDVEFDISIGESTETPAYRQLAQDFYNQLLQNKLIDLETALEFGNFPNGDALLASIRAKRERAEQAAQQQQMQQQGSPANFQYQDPTMANNGRPESPIER